MSKLEFKEEDVLEQLPSHEESACKDCGSIEWSSCKTHPDGGFHQCDKCHVWDEKEQKLIRKNLQ